MGVQLTTIHWTYLAFIIIIIAIMIKKRDTSLPCLIGIFILGLLATKSITSASIGVFNSLVYAIKELLPTIFIISVIVAMSQTLSETGINEIMIKPFTRFIKTPTLAYWIIGILMMIISWFFWPSPAVALIGVVLLPVALDAGLPALGVAMAMNLFGHGIALSGDFVIQGAPKLTADAAGIPVGEVVSASIPLVIIMGLVTTITAFIILKIDMKKGVLNNKTGTSNPYFLEKDSEIIRDFKKRLTYKWKIIISVLIPILFALDVVLMTKLNLRGGDATALVGGTTIFILILISIKTHRNRSLEEITSYLIKGLQFGFKVFGPVIPIAAFFYLGDSAFGEIFGKMPEASLGIVNDLGKALANTVPINAPVSAVTLTSIGAITGLDGSGFSGISLAGATAKLFSSALGGGTATLTALGQISAIWVGGGTLIPWALIPVAAICKVNPFDLARRNLVPVIIGLVATTIVAIFFL